MKMATPNRILMTADTVGGVWTYAMELVGGLGEHGSEVMLATMGARLTARQWEEARRIPTLEVRESIFKLEWMDDPWADVARAGEWLLDLEREFQPDLIHLNGYAHAQLGWHAPRIVAGHSCVLSWWQGVKGERAPAKYERYKEAVEEGLHAADAVVAISREMLRALREHYGAFARSFVIPNGRNPGKYNPKPKEDFILSAGRLWDEAKNVAAVCACSFDLEWPVRVAGDCRHPDGPESRFTNVEYLGWLSEAELADQYARAAIYAFPARYEPFGLSVLEAAMSQCALVLGDIPSLRENWDGAAIFIDPTDHAALLSALQYLVARPALRRELGLKARQRGLGFSSDFMVEKYIQMYSQFLNHHEETSNPQEIERAVPA